MIKQYLLALVVILCISIGLYITSIINASVEQVTFTNSHVSSATPVTNKRILLVHMARGFGGAEVHKIELYKQMLHKGYAVDLLVAKNSPMTATLQKLKLPYYTTKCLYFNLIKKLVKYTLSISLADLYKKQPYDIIQCYTEYEAWAAQQIAQKRSIKIILERHIPNPLKYNQTIYVDGIIAVSKPITEALQEKARELTSSTIITHIPGFFDEDKFLSCKPTITKKAFFREKFALEINNAPIITMIAVMPKNLLHKNHTLLLKAIYQLIYKKKKSLQVLLVGNGEGFEHIKKQAQTLQLQKYVHFLGFTDQTPGILYYSDMHVLASSQDAFPLVNIEASCMKKPIIAAWGTGAVDIIRHGYNGLLFKNNDVDDLVEKIETLLDNPALRQEMGLNAFQHAQKHFSNEIKFTMLEQFYRELGV